MSSTKRLSKIDTIEKGGTIPSTIRKVQLGKMARSPRAQRDLRPSRIAKLVSEMDLDQIGVPVLNERENKFFIIDGQHRIEALKQWLGDGWEKQVIDCRVYSGLTEKQEADVFDKINDTLAVSTLDKFKVRLTAGRPDETIVAKIIEQEGLHIGRHRKLPGALSCVGTLLDIYRRSGSDVLQSSLSIVSKSFGDAGLEAGVIDGVSRVVDRYGKSLNRDRLKDVLSGIRGGVSGITNRASVIRKQTGNVVGSCVAAAIVDVYNVGAPRGKKLATWWKVIEGDSPEVRSDE